MKKQKDKEEDKRIWFTADLHLNHANILYYCKRPFKNVQEMDETIIKNFTNLLRKNDVLYILGDLSFKREYAENFLRIIKNIGVEIHFIIGNHDKDGRTLDIIEQYCESVQEIKEIKIDGTHITLCHYPMRSWNGSYHGAWHLYGHVHGRLKLGLKQYDVGVDTNEFKPVSYTWLKKMMKHGLLNEV